jgi:hypothetical protein
MLSKELRIRCSRATIGVLGALVAAGAIAGQPALASAKATHHRARHATSASLASATKASSESQTARANAALHAAAEEAVRGLVREGTIDQYEAEVIDRQIDAGSVNPGELVARGVVSESQMRAVETVLAEVKRSFGN